MIGKSTYAISSANLDFARTAASIPVPPAYLRLGMQIIHRLDGEVFPQWEDVARTVLTNTFPELWRTLPEIKELKKFGPRRRVFDLLLAAWSLRTLALLDYVAARNPELIMDLEFWMAFEGTAFLMDVVADTPLIIEAEKSPCFGRELDEDFQLLVAARSLWQYEANERGKLRKVALRSALEWLRRWGFNIDTENDTRSLGVGDRLIGQADALGRDIDLNCPILLHTVPTLPLLFATEPTFMTLLKEARVGCEKSGDHSAIVFSGATLIQTRTSKLKSGKKSVAIFGGWRCTFDRGDTKVIPFLLDGNGARSLNSWSTSFFGDHLPARLYDACGQDREVLRELEDWSVAFTYNELQALKDEALDVMGWEPDSRPFVRPAVFAAFGEWAVVDPTLGFDPDALAEYRLSGSFPHMVH